MRLDDASVTPSACRYVGWRRGRLCLATHLAAFAFGVATPDAESFVALERIFEALCANFAGLADPLCASS